MSASVASPPAPLLAAPGQLQAHRPSPTPEPALLSAGWTARAGAGAVGVAGGLPSRSPIDLTDECHSPFAAQVASAIRRAESAGDSRDGGFVRQESLATPLLQPACHQADMEPGILHFGTGHFALSHLASYVDSVLGAGDLRWGIVAVSLRSGSLLRELAASGGRHLLLERMEGRPTKATILQAVHSTVAPDTAAQEVPRWIADPRIRLLTLTITINGYYFLGPEQELNLHHPEVQHDLFHPEQPKTIYGFLAAGLRRREAAARAGKEAPLVLLPLDNVEHCGSRFKHALEMFLRASKERRSADAGEVSALLTWMDTNVDVLNSMVDRITPNCEAGLAQTFRERWNVPKETPVIITETYKELVHTRSRFEGALPPWDRFGVKIVERTDDDWRRKGYLLNGVHHACAVMAKRFGGIVWVHEAVQHPVIRTMLAAVSDELCVFLTACGEDSALARQYARTTRERFCNSACPDTVERVGAQSTRKTNQRVLGAILDTHTRLGFVPAALTLLVGCWLLNVVEPSEQEAAATSPAATAEASGGSQPDPADTDCRILPSVRLAWAAAKKAGPLPPTKVRELLGMISEESGFPLYLATADLEPFVTGLTEWLNKLRELGVAACVAQLHWITTSPRRQGGASQTAAVFTHLLLDCDGTLVDSEGLAFRTSVQLVNSWLSSRGVSSTYTAHQLLTEFVGSSFGKIIAALATRHGLPEVTPAEMQELIEREDTAVTEVLTAEVRACDGAVDALLPLCRSGEMRLAVVTSSSFPRVHASLVAGGVFEPLGSPPIFSAVSSLPVPRSKPDPSVYLKAVLELRTTPTACLAVEDSVSGTTAAVRAGCVVIGYTGTQAPDATVRAKHAERLRAAGATEVIEHWCHFRALLRERGWTST